MGATETKNLSELIYVESCHATAQGRTLFLTERLTQTGLLHLVALTPPTIEIVGFLGGAARFITKPCLKQRVMRFPTVRYGCSV